MKRPAWQAPILILFLLLAAASFAWFRVLSPEAMERSSRELLMSVSTAISREQNADILVRHAHESWFSEFQDQFNRDYAITRPLLGEIVNIRESEGELVLTHPLRLRSQSMVGYDLRIDFEKGDGRIVARMIWESGRWQFLEFQLYRVTTAS